jgi:hypothetical protein
MTVLIFSHRAAKVLLILFLSRKRLMTVLKFSHRNEPIICAVLPLPGSKKNTKGIFCLKPMQYIILQILDQTDGVDNYYVRANCKRIDVIIISRVCFCLLIHSTHDYKHTRIFSLGHQQFGPSNQGSFFLFLFFLFSFRSGI